MSKGKSPSAFFLFVLALSIPFWFPGPMTEVQVIPGLTLINLAAFVPVIAALILVYRENRTAGMVELLKRSFDCKRIKSRVWYLPMILLYPCIVLVEDGVLCFSGLQIPPPQFSCRVLLMFVVFFIGALGEELGWTGYALDPMQERLGALKASILLGFAWAAFHVPMFAVNGLSPYWIAWQCLYIVAGRVLFVWIYNNTGKSLFAMGIIHASLNDSWQLFPISRRLVVPSFYDPRILALAATFVALIVAFLWEPKTLAQYRYARAGN
jgi:membrane protease YdiL (CAAX protease family)